MFLSRNDFLGFGDVVDLIFNRPVKDMSPVSYKKIDNGYSIILNTLGINPEDIKIDILDDYSFTGIKIYGESEFNGEKYDTSFKIQVAKSIMNNIKKIEKQSKNGITIINLVLVKSEKRDIEIVDI